MRPALSHLAGYESKDIRTALWHFDNPPKILLHVTIQPIFKLNQGKGLQLVSALASPGVCSSCGINTKGTLATLMGMKIP